MDILRAICDPRSFVCCSFSTISNTNILSRNEMFFVYVIYLFTLFRRRRRFCLKRIVRTSYRQPRWQPDAANNRVLFDLDVLDGNLYLWRASFFLQQLGLVVHVVVFLGRFVVVDMVHSQRFAEDLEPKPSLIYTKPNASSAYANLDPIQIVHRQHRRPLVLVAYETEALLLAGRLVAHQIDVDNFAVLREYANDVALAEVVRQAANKDPGTVAILVVPGRLLAVFEVGLAELQHVFHVPACAIGGYILCIWLAYFGLLVN